MLLACRTARGHGWTKADAHLPDSGLACGAAAASSRIACTCSTRVGLPFGESAAGSLCLPLRGRWCKGDYVHGTGGGRLPGGRLATKLVGIRCRFVVESLYESTRHGAHSL